MTTPKETFDYCEQLIENQLNSFLTTKNPSTNGVALINFKEELKVLYKHLENIQKMKTSYNMGR